jgi:hypothetical protein
MDYGLFILFIIYASVPPITLFHCLKWIYKDNWIYGWHLLYFFKLIFTLSFLPLLAMQNLNLGLIPQHWYSLTALLLTCLFAVLGLRPAIKEKVLYFYLSGVYASFMEEILYRSILFSFIQVFWHDQWISLGVTSFLFGTWHLKNYYWSGKKEIIFQFFYTFLIYGPIFSLLRIFSGDIYLAVLFHYLADATCALAPNWMRGWLVQGGRGGNYMDDYQIIKSRK